MDFRRRIAQLPPGAQVLLRNLAVLLAYVLAARFGLAYAFISGYASPIWPPTGVAIAALFLLGQDCAPAILLGALAENLRVGAPPLAALGMAGGNLLEAVCAVALLRRVNFRAAMDRTRDVVSFALLGATLATVLGASIGMLSLVLGHSVPPAGSLEAWWVWWLGDLLGALVLSPVLLTFAAGPPQHWGRRRTLEALGLGSLLAAVSYVVFSGILGPGPFQFSLAYAVFPFCLWAAYRFGPRGASLATLLAAMVAVATTTRGEGPFVHAALHENLVLLGSFLALLAVSSLLLAASAAEQRRNEEALQMQARVIELSTEAVAMVGLDGRLSLLNHAGRALLGLPGSGGLGGLPVLRLLEAEERGRFQREVLPAVLRRGRWNGELILHHQGCGEPIPTRQSVFSIKDSRRGGLIGFGIVGHDIREERRSESALRQTQRLESLGVLAGGIAHDFNNLLTAMIGNLELAELHLGEEHAAAPFLGNLSGLMERSTGLVRQMMDYAGRGRFEMAPLDLGLVAKEMAQLLQISVSKSAELKLDIAAGLPPVRADRAQLEQVIMNLVINASEALEERGGAIRLGLRPAQLDERELRRRFPAEEQLQPGAYVLLEVADSGCGMPPEVMEKIFDPFFTTKFLGRGLGLSAIRGILQAHGGAVQVRSRQGEGSTFTLAFPVWAGELPSAFADRSGSYPLVPAESSGETDPGTDVQELDLEPEGA